MNERAQAVRDVLRLIREQAECLALGYVVPVQFLVLPLADSFAHGCSFLARSRSPNMLSVWELFFAQQESPAG